MTEMRMRVASCLICKTDRINIVQLFYSVRVRVVHIIIIHVILYFCYNIVLDTLVWEVNVIFSTITNISYLVIIFFLIRLHVLFTIDH